MALRMSALLTLAIAVTAGCQAKNSGGSSKRPATSEPVTPTTPTTGSSTSTDVCATYTTLQTCTAVVGCAWNGTKCATAPVNTTPVNPGTTTGGSTTGGSTTGGSTQTYCTAFNTQALCAAGPGCVWNGSACTLTGMSAAPTPASCTPFTTQALCSAGLSCMWNASKNSCLRPSVGLGTPFVARDGLSNVGVPANQMINCNFSALFGTDGNFVVYQGSQPIWSTKSAGKGGTRIILQGDGNLVMYNSANAPVWSSTTANKGAIGMLLSTSGTLAIVDANGAPVWTSGLTVPGCY